MTSKFLKSFFTKFFDAFDDNKPIVDMKDLLTYSPHSTVCTLASEKILKSFVNALEIALKENISIKNPKLAKTRFTLYYTQNYTQKNQDSTMSAGELLLVDLSQFHAPTAKKLENLLEPSLDENPLTLRDHVSALLVRLNEMDISDEIEQKEMAAASSSYEIQSTAGGFSELKETDPDSPTNIIAKFGTSILEKLTEMDKIPTSKFGGSNAEVVIKYCQELLLQLKENANHLCPAADKKVYPAADKKGCVMM